MKTFEEFINSLDKKDKDNFNHYSPIRGVQAYRIIFEHLAHYNVTVTYEDVNSIVRCDKSLKEALYPMFAVIEEMMRSYIFAHYSLKKPLNDKMNFKSFYKIKNNDKVMVFPKLIEKDNPYGVVDDLYRNFNLSFADIVSLYEYYKIKTDLIEKYESVRKLRNMVMHHRPLFFTSDDNWSIDKLKKVILDLHDLLPDDYKESLYEKINEPISKTRENVNKCFHNELLEVFKNV